MSTLSVREIKDVETFDNSIINDAYRVANASFAFANGVSTNTTAAFAKANNALANASGTFAGDLTISGQATVAGPTPTLYIQPSTANNNALVRCINNGGTAYLGLDNNVPGLTANFALNLYHSGPYPIIMSTNSVQRMRIDSDGNLLAGTTSNISLVGDLARLALVNSGAHQLYCRGAASGYTQASIVLASATTDSPESRGLGTYLFNEGIDVTWYMGTFYSSADNCGFARATGATFNNAAGDGANYRLRVDSSGNLTILGSTATKASGTAWVNPSDSRLKRDIIDYDKGLVELNNVRVRKWKFNGKGGTIDGSDAIGVIADEIMTVLPETVTEYEAKLNPDDETNTKIKKFDATEITWLLVNSVKELSAKLDEANARIAKLEGN